MSRQLCLTLCDPMDYSPPGSSVHGIPRARILESKVKVAQSCPALCDPIDYTVHGILQARILEWVAFPFSRGSSQPRDQAQVSCTAGGFFTSRATREAQEYWSGYLSLLQGIFLTQESNQGLLHCRWILYQLSHKESQRILELVAYPFSSRSSQPRNQTRVSALWADSLPGAQYLYIK